MVTHNSFDKWFDSQNKKVDWGELQVRSSADHSLKQTWLNYFIWHIYGNKYLNKLGGMNFQIEHHLFPAVSHCHYLEISKIVRETCSEFSIPYPENETWLDCFKGYYEVVKQNSI
jgi:linoleoyl-CoA desaturase